MGKLDGKVAVVTGASRGIGLEIAQLFGAEGAKVVCAARTLREGEHPLAGSLQSTVRDIIQGGGEAVASTVNISLPEDCDRLIQEARQAFGPVDILVNNAALTYFIPVKDYPVSRWMRSWAVNFHAPFLLTQLVLPDMIESKSGSILNISSGAAIGPGRGPYEEATGTLGSTCYGSEKAALERFSQGLAEEVYQYGISVTCLSPSKVVPTPGTIFHNLVTGASDPQGESPHLMALASLVLVTEPTNRITGRVTYSQQILKEMCVIDESEGTGTEGGRTGSGYSQI